MAEPFLSEIRMTPFGFAPNGRTACDGQLLPTIHNQALLALPCLTLSFCIALRGVHPPRT
jgi:microcystin-dependent protein